MQDFIIECDTRQQKESHIIKYFADNNIRFIKNKLYAGDYKLVNSAKIIVDTKKDLLELCGNLTKTTEHERVKREIECAKEIGCERFIFLIADPQIKFVDEVYTWKRPLNWKTKKYRTQVQPATLQKIMQTMATKYGVEFLFCTKEQMGKYVVDLLTDN